MMLSIRKFLLINLLMSITMASLLTVVGNYFFNQKDIHHHFDEQLSQVALSFEAFIEKDLNPERFKQIQETLNNISDRANQIYQSLEKEEGFTEPYEDKFHFQLWDHNENLLLHSNSAPTELLSEKINGFSNRLINNKLWRVFSLYNPKTHLNIILAERYDTRYELGHRIAEDEAFLMLIIYPILGFMIWIIVGKGLRSLQRITYEVADRASNHLNPVNLKNVPLEIIPLIDELNKLFVRLRDAFEKEKRFAGDAAHELRTPLAVLRTQAQIAQKTTDPSERKDALKKMIQSVDRSSHVVQQLLTLSRLTPEVSRIINTQEIHLSNNAAEVIATLAPLALEKFIDIELITPERKNLLIKGDSIAISILIRNLVDNAIRYTPNYGKVWVYVIEYPDYIQFKIVDTGPGIPIELQSRVFERFYRIIGTKEQGSGLGLAIVREIALLHDAKILLYTNPEGGLCIEINFPK